MEFFAYQVGYLGHGPRPNILVLFFGGGGRGIQI